MPNPKPLPAGTPPTTVAAPNPRSAARPAGLGAAVHVGVKGNHSNAPKKS